MRLIGTKAASSGCVAAGVVLALCAFASTSTAGGATAQCLSAAEQAQQLRQAGKLRAARQQAAACTAPACPAMVRADCGKWAAEIERSMPGVVLAAQDSAGADLRDVRVSMDGEELTSTLDGKAIAVDPGDHTFRFATKDLPPVEQHVIIREGERDRRVTVRFSATPPPKSAPAGPAAPHETLGASSSAAPDAATPRDRATPALVYVLGSAGIVGGAVFGVFLWQGYSAKSDLDGLGCEPSRSCPQDKVDAMSRDFVIADVAMYGGAVLLATAAVLYFTRPSSGPATGSVGLRLRTSARDAVFGLDGTF